MKQLTMTIAVAAAVLMMSACSGKTSQPANDADSLQTDSVTVETAGNSADKHSEAYLRIHVDSIYSIYKNPAYEKSGMRIYNGKVINRDSAYCSQRYLELLEKALKVAEENEDLLIDYDHWTNSQDDNEFTYEVGNISQKTDSTAIVSIKAKNFGRPCVITLSMLFERGDWYVDDFLSDDGTGKKAFFEEYIKGK